MILIVTATVATTACAAAAAAGDVDTGGTIVVRGRMEGGRPKQQLVDYFDLSTFSVALALV